MRRSAATVESVDSVTHRALESLFGLEAGLSRYRATVARRFNIAVPDLTLLSSLANGGGRATPRELALALHLSSGTLTSMLDRAENAGLIRRSPNPDDRRSVLIDMTPDGHQATAHLNKGIYEAISQTLPPQARASLARALGDLLTALDDKTDKTDKTDNAGGTGSRQRR